ncbi:S1C family serine protease [Alphaproteobacteria bacterium]|nr:S1C family serine protease [Alphaproteobacteria bacterium]
MSEDLENKNWEVPLQSQPNKRDFEFDLEDILNSIVFIRADIPEDAFTAQVLGTERTGSGVLIKESGLILTVGYIVAESSKIWITANDGTTIPGDLVSYNYETGFGLIQPLGRLGIKSLSLGDSSNVNKNDSVIFASAGGKNHSLISQVSSVHPFVGSWEYAIDEAIYTAPVHPNWAGAAVINAMGQLIGIGSLFVQNVGINDNDGNMSIPINLFKNQKKFINKDYINSEARPWLGIYVSDEDQYIKAVGVVAGGPAAKSGIKAGDKIVAVGEKNINNLYEFYKTIWSYGSPGSNIPILIKRSGHEMSINIFSTDRYKLMRKPTLHS